MTNRYYGQWSPPVDQVLYENYFKKVPKGFFIDCGASDGLLHSCTKFFEDSGWDGICLEPSPKAFAELIKNRRVTSLNAGLSTKNGKITFTEAVHPVGSNAGFPAGGSVKYPDDLRNFVGSFGYKFSDILIDVIAYDSLIKRFGITHVDLMVIDVEGYELSVIGGMSVCLPDVICAEHSFVGLGNLKDCLGKLGYNFDLVSFNNAFFSFGKLHNA